jgi:hypothetical protein
MADVEPLYCAEQIKVPEGLPEILKEYTKAIIREQPKDINAWSAKCVRGQRGQRARQRRWMYSRARRRCGSFFASPRSTWRATHVPRTHLSPPLTAHISHPPLRRWFASKLSEHEVNKAREGK